MAPTASGAPPARRVVEEDNPTHGNLVGRVEHIAQMGTLVTDFLLIKPGALHRANGGYLLLDARRLLLSPVRLGGPEARHQGPRDPHRAADRGGGLLISTQTLDPEPIPLDVKVVLFGDRELYYMLSAADPDFSRLFKVQADFDDSIARSTENDNAYARLIASVVKEHGLKPFDAAGVARLIDEGARLADDREKLSIEIGRIADIVREADYWSGAGQAQGDDQAGRGPRHRRADPARRPAARPGAGDDRPRHRAGRYGGRPGRADQRAVRAPARLLRVRPAEPHHRARAPGLRPRHRHRARGQARRPAALQGRDDPVGLPGRPLRARRAAGARRHPGVRAVLRRRRRRQRVLGRALCAALGAGRACRSSSRWPSPAPSTSGARCRRSAASTRRSRASSTSAARGASTSSRAC